MKILYNRNGFIVFKDKCTPIAVDKKTLAAEIHIEEKFSPDLGNSSDMAHMGGSGW